MKQLRKHLISSVAACILSISMGSIAVADTAKPLSPNGPYADAHFHIANYAFQGVSMYDFIHKYMGDQVLRSVVMPLPLQQKWNAFDHFANDVMPVNYYAGPKTDSPDYYKLYNGPKSELYYYGVADALYAKEYLTLSKEDQNRLDPMITGFNPMDLYGVQHIKRILLSYPGVFSGIGEFTVHKEIVEDKLAGESIAKTITGQAIPVDVQANGKNSLYNPALKKIFDFAGESGLVVNLHSDIYRARIKYDGSALFSDDPEDADHDGMYPDKPYTADMIYACKQSPSAKVIWAHTGLGRFVWPTADHLQRVSAILDACPNWGTDLSWDLVQNYIVNPKENFPSQKEWVDFITKYQDRLFWGSDTVIFKRNKIGKDGKPIIGVRMTQEEYLGEPKDMTSIWKAVGPEVTQKVKIGNYVRVFDAARKSVREWEKKHAKDDIWNLAP